jgi:hypothetical protein
VGQGLIGQSLTDWTNKDLLCRKSLATRRGLIWNHNEFVVKEVCSVRNLDSVEVRLKGIETNKVRVTIDVVAHEGAAAK